MRIEGTPPVIPHGMGDHGSANASMAQFMVTIQNTCDQFISSITNPQATPSTVQEGQQALQGMLSVLNNLLEYCPILGSGTDLENINNAISDVAQNGSSANCNMDQETLDQAFGDLGNILNTGSVTIEQSSYDQALNNLTNSGMHVFNMIPLNGSNPGATAIVAGQAYGVCLALLALPEINEVDANSHGLLSTMAKELSAISSEAFSNNGNLGSALSQFQVTFQAFQTTGGFPNY